MGSHHSHEAKEGGGSGFSTPRRGSHRGISPRGSNAGSDTDKVEKPPPPSLIPVEKLVKLLAQRSQKEDGVNGITEKIFTKYVFPLYPDLSTRFYRYVRHLARSRTPHVPPAAFRAQCERVLALIDDHQIIDTYVRMFADEEDENTVQTEGLRNLLYISYKLSMDHYPEGPQTCLQIHHTLSAVVNGCFNKKDSHSVGFVVRWLEEHCHRLIFPVHRYCVHMLATRHRELEAAAAVSADPAVSDSHSQHNELELATPVLERCGPQLTASNTSDGYATPGAGSGGGALLALSTAWLLAAAAPKLYSMPIQPPKPNHASLASRVWLARLVCAVPVHWTPLYNSREHGMGANRFLHHTLAYRGPTLVLIEGQELVLVLCVPSEWKETHQYWGSQDSALIQLQPTFAVIEQAAKMLYLNTSIRGYPKGLRAGADPRKPTLIIPEDFDTLTFQGVPYTLNTIEVWGCGDQASRETQLEIKKWQVKEAERQNQVKLSAADWLEHPDRYLLELAGRPQYRNGTS